MVPPDSYGLSRAPYYLGSHSGGAVVVVYRAITFCGDPFAWSSTNAALCHSLLDRQIQLNGPTTPNAQRLPAITRDRFSLFRFRSPLLTESRLLSLPVGTEMFHFPTFPPHALCVQARVAEFYSTGFPHSDILGSQLGCQLLEAYRRLLRPSSAPDAQASTVRP